ncbi:class I SAM-dependent methyltransferase [Cohnella panacarvi]|uniref:class I SAM-dependent methyltransferase n=1 Tax=Cohnella panacarvi TaxID=400776 RepID=UPI00047B1A30|nr:class I SAM-dependent methyltransferase [Cohnella panacarvi]
MIVTTPENPDAQAVERARAIAEEWSAAFVPRLRNTIAKLSRTHGNAEVAVVGPKEIKLVSPDAPPFFFHPSMAMIRIKRLMAGEPDSLIAVSEAASGDVVLDCTAGFGSDALVFSYAVGRAGEVIALEASPVLHGIVREGLSLYESGLPDVDRAMRAIHAVNADYESYLRRMADNSVDIVYFDPMFERPIESSTALAPIRSQAHMEPLTLDSVREAVRVARKAVVLKDHRDSGQFARLGFSLARKSYSSVAYGVIKIE